MISIGVPAGPLPDSTQGNNHTGDEASQALAVHHRYFHLAHERPVAAADAAELAGVLGVSEGDATDLAMQCSGTSGHSNTHFSLHDVTATTKLACLSSSNLWAFPGVPMAARRVGDAGTGRQARISCRTTSFTCYGMKPYICLHILQPRESSEAGDTGLSRYMRCSGPVPIVPAKCDRTADRRAAGPTARVHRLRHLLCGSRSAEGQTVLEFALVFMLFMFLVFGVFDFGHLFFVKMGVQNAVQEAARYGSTGNHLPDPNNPGNNLSRVDSIIATLQRSSVGPDITNVQISSLNGGTDSAGGPGDIMTITVTASVPLFTPLIANLFPRGRYAFKTSVTIKNEPFPASETN